ncbi:hypothetical protein [Candidatus Nitrosocosmicus hydrocola]|uniref:hypothetical protein n=1 Tax=Candidatus Nitrosocosmicus hydrocola TaxID=1826872 RepID=UPI0011E5D0D5|nr:hypothetical protein [Candidatus Nitrosocosmicus hydrocola]
MLDIKFHPIPTDIHLGIVKIPIEEILDDDVINNTEATIVGTDRIQELIEYKQLLLENLKGMES